jgi:PKD repeat protein
MKKCLSVFIITAFMLFASNFVFSMVQVGEEVAQRFETPHPYPGKKAVVWEKEFNWPNAGYIAIHFTEFELAKGDWVEISSPDGRYYYTFSEKGKKVKHKDKTDEISEFWATHIPGDTAIVRLISKNKKNGHGFVIDKWVRGHERGYIEAVMDGLEDEATFEAVCSSDDKEWAKCYLGTTMYDEARAVCRLLINGSSACTGWLLGSEGHVMTNNHCISTQTSASNTDYEFMAEGATCSTSCASWGACPGTVEASSGSLIQTDSNLDYTLVLLPSNITGTYGYMQLRDTLPSLDERIYIPQHPSAWGKQLAVESDTDGPYAKIYSTNQTPCMGGPGDIGYYADTAGGSSGSPVLAYSDHLVVALHHCANCPNRGVPIPPIITDLGSNLPANAIGGGSPTQPPVANFSGSPTTVQLGNSVQFTDLSTNNPTSWSWSFEGGTPSSSTAQNPSVTYNTAGTYNVTLTATNSAGSDGETKIDYITVQSGGVTYCTSSGNNQNYEYIAGVQVANLNNSSGASAYSNFTGMTADLTAGGNAGVSLTPGFVGSSYTEWWKIWIDYNIDGDFEDSGEEVFSGSGSSTVSGSFNVPSGASGETRMRVSMSYSTYPPYCGTFTYGEVEDYTVDISGGGGPSTGTVGNTTIFGSSSVSGYRRAMPFTMPENGTITSVTMYHTGGSGSMILGVYDGSSTPQNRLAVTPTTAVSGSTGWQTINLTGSAYVSGGSTVWLAWVYESNPGIRYQTGSPGRYQSSATWSGGMPNPFGTGSQTTYIYSIYATYNK